MKVKSESEVVQSYPTLSDPMDCSLPGSSTHSIFQARVLEWGAIAFSNLIYDCIVINVPTTIVLQQLGEISTRDLMYNMMAIVKTRPLWWLRW